jgi:hypothetical protein
MKLITLNLVYSCIVSHEQKKIFEPLVIVSNALAGGGAEKTMLALHREFVKKGINCYLVALNQSLEIDDMKNIKVLNRFWGDNFKLTVGNFLNFKGFLDEINPRTIIVNCELPELYISLLRKNNRRIICVEHTTIPWHGRRILGLIVRTLLRIRQIEWVTVINGTNHGNSNRKMYYIPNPFVNVIDSRKELNRNCSLVFIGGLKDNKRPDWVIEAGVRNSLPVDVYGDGYLYNALKTKYSNPDLNITFHGFKSNVWDNIHSNSLVVVPSEFEGDGMVVVEAIISGYPVLLAKNKDLLRFRLNEKHYFGTLTELISLINQYKKNNFKDLIVEDNFVENLKKERSIEWIVKAWILLLSTPKPDRPESRV